MNNFNFAFIFFVLSVCCVQAKPSVSITGFSPNQYKAGTVITLSGFATDPIDGTLPGENFQWFALYKHNDHYHDGPAFSTGDSIVTFEVPPTFDFSSDVFYRIVLIVRNSNDETDTARVDIQPLLSTFVIDSDPQGVDFNMLNGSVVSPNTLTGIQNVPWTCVGPLSTTISGETYLFKKWSDGTTSIALFFNAPESFTRYLASYVKKSDVYLNASASDESLSSSGAQYVISISSNFSWTVGASDTWITPDKTFGLDSSNLVLTISPNLTANLRTGNVNFTVAGIAQHITITQAGANLQGLSEDIGAALKIKLYPNPFSNNLFIETVQSELPIQIQLLDLYGTVRLNKNIQSVFTSLETADLASGFYYLSIAGGNKRITKRIIKL